MSCPLFTFLNNPYITFWVRFLALLYQIFKMSGKSKKQFGVWMDSQHAIVVGRENVDSGSFVILAHEKC